MKEPLPPLTPEQERMAEENLGLVIHVLKRYNRDLRYEWDDAYQYGCMGLVEAVRNYNPEKGAAFSSFAVRCIYFSVHRWEIYNTRKKNSFGKNTVNYSLEYRTPYMPKPREFHEMLIPPDYVPMEDELAKKELIQKVKAYMNTFPREAQLSIWLVSILRVRTAAEVGKMVGKTDAQVYAMIKKYMRLLRIYGERLRTA
ncbi:MAG: sigma-70 family RNA polymerase sigma factor [Clostridia bacterium]|nr:sigma-70 family RNA polymerase sigma factor [Clostridia bacterium]